MVCKRLEKIRRDFLWGGGNLDHKPHLVKWATVCTDKKFGGLGFRGLYKLNKALLRETPYGGRLSTESLARCRGWCSGENKDNLGTRLWKEI